MKTRYMDKATIESMLLVESRKQRVNLFNLDYRFIQHLNYKQIVNIIKFNSYCPPKVKNPSKK